MQKEFLSTIHTQRSKSILKIENSRFFIGKEEFAPFSAEMHYFRVNKRHWSFCFERIRRAGFKIVSTAIPWNLHEAPVGMFDFSGNTDPRKDLIVFLELAREFGLKVIVKPGPYIDSQWHNGGYPDYVFEMQEVLARDSQGSLVPISDGFASQNGKLPSLAHPRFRSQVKKYINNLCEVLKHYSFPKGPIFAIQLDHQTGSWGSPFQFDYNPESIRLHFSQFLQKTYPDLRKLNSLYREKWKSWEEVIPPRELKIKNPKDLVRYFDWVAFQEEETGRYLKSLKEFYQENEIGTIFFDSLPVRKEILPNFDHISLATEQIHPTGEGRWNEDFFALERQFSFWGALKFPWLSTLACGSPSANPTEHRKYFPVTPTGTKFIFVLALSCGVKAFNFSMFVERDHWYDSPLGVDGSIQPNFEIASRLAGLSEKLPLNTLQSSARVGLALYKPYGWYNSLQTQVPFDYFPQLERTLAGISQDLGFLKIEYQVLDLESSSFDTCDMVIIPSAEFMAPGVQEKIIGLVKSGKKVILYGLVPQWDLGFAPCKILAKFLKLKSALSHQVAEVETREQSFPAFMWGTLRKAGKGPREIAWGGGKCVATSAAVGKGAVYFFTFDFTSHKNPQKIIFLEELYHENKIVPNGSASDPEVIVKVQKGDGFHLLYLFNPTGNFWNPKPEGTKDVIIQLNIKKFGLKGGLKLSELVSGEVIKTSAKELAEGMVFKLGEFDSRIYMVGK